MSHPKILVFDCESTGIDVFNDRIVQLFMAVCDGRGNPLETWEWIIDPGVEVPEEASNVHGMTTEWLQEHGNPPVTALQEAIEVFDAHEDLTWVAFNMNYDFSILYAEFVRHGVRSGWAEDVNDAGVRMFDPLVVDRAKDKYRKGSRKLINQAQHYGIPVQEDKLHDADYDVEITAKVAVAVARKFGVPSNTEQAEMYRVWSENFQQFLRKTDPDATVDTQWPIRTKEN